MSENTSGTPNGTAPRLVSPGPVDPSAPRRSRRFGSTVRLPIRNAAVPIAPEVVPATPDVDMDAPDYAPDYAPDPDGDVAAPDDDADHDGPAAGTVSQDLSGGGTVVQNHRDEITPGFELPVKIDTGPPARPARAVPTIAEVAARAAHKPADWPTWELPEDTWDPADGEVEATLSRAFGDTADDARLGWMESEAGAREPETGNTVADQSESPGVVEPFDVDDDDDSDTLSIMRPLDRAMAGAEWSSGPEETADPVADPDRSVSRGRGPWPLLGGAATVLVLAVTFAVVLTHSLAVSTVSQPVVGGTSADATAARVSTTAAPSAPTSSPLSSLTQHAVMLGWVKRSLPIDARIVADPQTAPQLRQAGFSNVVSDAQLVDFDQQNVDYLITVPHADTRSDARAELAAAAVPLAVFGPGSDPVTVAQVFPAGTVGLALRRSDDQRARTLAAAQVPQNPRINFMGNTRTVVASGTLDLRVTTVLVVLAQQSTVWIRDISIDPAEKRAGQPARALTLTVDDALDVQTVVAGLPSVYRPSTVASVSAGTVHLVWSPAIAAAVTDGQ